MAPVTYLETGVLYCAENLERLAELPDGCVDLIYLDPPFFSNRTYEVIWGDEAEVRSFKDRWEAGLPTYVQWMGERLTALYRVLKPTGSLYLHCDPSASHHLKLKLDALFGPTQFRNEIVWKRFSAKNDPRRFGRSHDIILYYTKGRKWTWHPQYGPFEQDYVEQNYRYVEEDTGRRYRLSDLTANKPGGDVDYEWHGVWPYKGRHWAYSRENMDRMLAEGRIVFRRTGMPVYKRYLDEQPGVPLQDVWTDIRLHAGSRERIGYPTQKPEALIERILSASTDEDDVVLDPFCGCGTTIAVAERLNRRWVGIDISPTAIDIVNRRILIQTNGTVSPELRDLPMTELELKALPPFEFQNWVMREVNGTASPRKSGDLGIDGLSYMYQEPIQVKQSYSVGRNVVDNFETAVRRSQKDVGYIVGFSFTRDAKREAIRAKSEENLTIVLVTVTELLEAVESVTRPRAATGERPDRPPTPDLLRLLEGRSQRTFPPPPPSSAKPSGKRLVESARENASADKVDSR